MQVIVDELVSLDTHGGDYVFHVPTSSFYEVDETIRAALNQLGEVPHDQEGVVPKLTGALGLPTEEAEELVRDLAGLRLLVPTEMRGQPAHEAVGRAARLEAPSARLLPRTIRR